MEVTEKFEELVSKILDGIEEVILSLGGEKSGKFEVVGVDIVNKPELLVHFDRELVYFWGKIEKAQGGIGVGFSESVVVSMLKLVGSEVESINQELKSALGELGEAILGGILGKLSSSAGKGVIQFERTQVSIKDDIVGAVVEDFFIDKIAICSLKVYGGIINGEAVVIIDEVIGKWFGIEFDKGKPSESPPGKMMSEEEIQSILEKELEERDSKEEVIMSKPESNMKNLGVILGIEVEVVARLGSVEMPLSSVLSLGPGSVVNVGHLVDEPIELYVNNKLIARGDVVIVDEKFGVRITEVVSQEERIESLR